jgi:hypothetical protein
MSQSFFVSEVLKTIFLHLIQLVKDNSLEALEKALHAAAHLVSAERKRRQPEALGFVEAIEARLSGNWVKTDFDLTLERAVNGDCGDRFLELLPEGGSFCDYIENHGALEDLGRTKFRGHRDRLKRYGFPLYPSCAVEGGFVIDKEAADQYLKVENLRIRMRSTTRKRASRQRRLSNGIAA